MRRHHHPETQYEPPLDSTDGQSVDAQVRQLRAVGARQVFREVASGAKTDRSQLCRALDQLDADDVLMVTRLDRLARSTRDLLNTLAVGARALTRPASADCAA
jgi:DNA invertase Pin-like site-specific DNA recombinase